MRFMDKFGRILTEYTSEMLFSQFEGTKEELALYVFNRGITKRNPKEYYGYEGKLMALKPIYFIGDYELIPDREGVIATDR